MNKMLKFNIIIVMKMVNYLGKNVMLIILLYNFSMTPSDQNEFHSLYNVFENWEWLNKLTLYYLIYLSNNNLLFDFL